MKVRFARALVVASLWVAAGSAQAQGAPTWYVGAAGGASHVSLTCDEGFSCDRTGTAWKVYGGYEWANRTGGELMYEDFGNTSTGSLGKLAVTDATIQPHAFGFAVFWHPEITGALSGKVKVGVSSARARLEANADGVPVDNDRKTEPHWWLAAGLAWRVAPHWDVTADYDWTRAGYRNDSHKQTSDVGALSIGAAWRF